jgi:uncharacterized cupredoxin-like copper-binding protein
MPNIGGVAEDAPGGRIADVQYRVDGGLWQPATASDTLAQAGGFDSAQEGFRVLATLSDGTHLVEARAIDWAGNVQAPPYAGVSVTIDRSSLPRIGWADLSTTTPAFPEDLQSRDYFRLGDGVRLMAALMDAGTTLPAAQFHADLTKFGLAANIQPNMVVGSEAYWFFEPLDVVTTGAGRTGPVSADVWVSGDEARRTRAVILADNTSPTASLAAIAPNPTRSRKVTISGQAADVGSWIERVAWRLDSGGVQEAVPTDGAWDETNEAFTCTSETLADGPHVVEVTTWDLVGNQASTSASFTVDTTMPYITGVTISDLDLPGAIAASYVRNGHRARVQAHVSDPYTTRTNIRANLSPLGGESDAAPATFVSGIAEWTTVTSVAAAPADGLLAVPVWVVVDGVPTGTLQGSILADNTTPTLALNPYTPNPTNATTVTFTGTAADSGSGVSEIAVKVNDGTWSTDGVSSNGAAFSAVVGGLSEGTHVVWIRAFDRVGFQGGPSSRSLTVDLTNPSMRIDQPTSFTWDNAPITLLWSSASSDLNTSEGILWRTPFGQTVATSSVVACGSAATLDGVYRLDVRGWDLAGNVSATTSTAFGIDATSPVVALACEQGGLTSATTLNFTVAVTEAESGIDSVEYSTNTVRWIEVAEAGGYAFTVAGLADGVHVIRARATDVAGNRSSESAVAVEVDTMGPVTAIDAPSSFTWGRASLALAWSARSADLATSRGVLWRTAFGGGQATSGSVTAGSLATAEGRYRLDVTAGDAAGNEGPTTSTAFGIDATSPAVALACAQGGLTSATTLNFTASVTEAESGIDSVEYSTDTVRWIEVVEAGGYAFTLSNVESGTHTVYARATDAAGNLSPADQVSVLVLTSGPAIRIDAPASDTISSGPRTILWSSDESIYVRANDLVGNDENTSPTDSNWAILPIQVDNDYPPAAPTGLAAGYISNTQVRVEWNKNTEPDLDHYDLFRRVNDGTTIGLTDLRVSPVYDGEGNGPNTYEDPVSSALPNYWKYGARAADRAGNASLFSEEVIVAPPNAPDKVLAIGRNARVDLQWKPVAETFAAGYFIYRATGDNPSSTAYTLRAEVSGRETAAFIDTSVVNGTSCWYYVRAFDGAHNTSDRSNLAHAVPSTVPSFRHGVLVRFEDGAFKQNIDWDFNDVGAKFMVDIQLGPNDAVTTVTIDATLWIHDASSNYDMYSAIKNLAGTGRYWGAVYRKNGNLDRTIATHTYNWQSTDLLTHNMPLFQNIGSGGGDTDGRRAVITLALDNPSSNPVATFDEAPFDTWIRLTTTHEERHIYDPNGGDNPDDAIQVMNDPDLAGLFLNLGLVINDLAWEQPYNGKKAWLVYPDFVEYAKTYRTLFVRKANWFENGPYNPN